MTYKERFAASKERAHYQNIATKILREMTELRSRVESSPTASKRWIWELIQNAKDVSIDGRVRIQIEVDLTTKKRHVTFRHNGQAFSAENIRFLIEQISSKDRKKDESGRSRTTGKFGTGFLTTHLLSEVVLVEGVAKEEGLEPRKFGLVLDRSGFDLDTITEAVKRAKSSVENLDDKSPYHQYIVGAFNTAFRYELADDTGIHVAKAGLADLDACMPYTLAFVGEIEAIELPAQKYNLRERRALINGEVQVVSMGGGNPQQSNAFGSYSLAVSTKGLTSIAIPIERIGEKISILRPSRDVPRLFCDFPLLGTEDFPFPVIINNPNFNPTDGRDGVFLTRTSRPGPQIDENKAIIREARSLYLSLLNHASNNGWENLHFLAAVHPVPSHLTWVDPAWYKTEVLTPVQNTLLNLNIVRTATGELRSILSEDGKKYIRFPSATRKEIRERLWLCCSSWFPHYLPARSDVEVWHGLIWDDCGKLTIGALAQFVELKGSIEALSKELVNKNVYEWLNEFYKLLRLDETEYDLIINKRRLFPNQNGDFCKKAELYLDSGDIDAVFKDVLQLLGQDLRAELLADEVNEDFEGIEKRDQAYAVKEITSQVQDKTADREVAKNFRPAFRKLLMWFRENNSLANRLFPVLCRQRHLLYDDEEILENIERAEQLNGLLAEYDVKTVEELRNLLTNRPEASALLPVTQGIIASMGITSVDEWQKALKDKNLSLLFSHKSTPTTDMFLYAQSLIRQAKEGIIAHLRKLQNYDLGELEETAPTILAGIRKNGRPLMIVARPAHGGEVIIYYGSERDVLDFEDSELWTYNGTQAQRVTLGHILKTAQIRRFPV